MKNPLKNPSAVWGRIKRTWNALMVAVKIVAGFVALRAAAKTIWDALHTVGVL